MVQIKLVLIILLSVVYYNEAEDQLAIDKKDWETYYSTKKEYITDIIYTKDLYDTQLSCYLCILREINIQLETIKYIYAGNKNHISDFKSNIENIKKDFGDIVLACENGMPTDTTETYFEKFVTTHYNQFKIYYGFQLCTDKFSRNNAKYDEFDNIRYRYEDDYLSYMIIQKRPELNEQNKNCLICIRDFVDFEVGRWIEIETYLRPKVATDTISMGQYWPVLTDIYRNYKRYINKVQTWITTCLSNSTKDVKETFETGPEIQKKKPLISKGKSDGMEECINYYIPKVKYSNLLASTGNTERAGDQVKFKPTDLIKLMNDL
ncbi:uncharacterized protein LOC142334158 [Lycorma delicatula]|uniref:uncharacterized protein LOC142334158 n=1 Tax=Lycorma delicatula TaxID=130591 RepID=UPI003F51307A